MLSRTLTLRHWASWLRAPLASFRSIPFATEPRATSEIDVVGNIFVNVNVKRRMDQTLQRQLRRCYY